MSAAPSDLSWDTWSASFLDHDNPVLQGQDKCSIPEFWKGSALFWSQCSSAESLNGSNVVVVHPGHQIVCSDNDVYSVGGVSQQEVLNNKDPLKVHKLTEDYTENNLWEEMPSRLSSICSDEEILSQRYGHCCCYYKGRIIVYGGRTQKMEHIFGENGNLSSYDVATGEWSDMPTLVDDCPYPLPRYGHAVTMNDDRSVLYIHGGHIKYAQRRWAWGFTSELLALDLATMTWRVESPHYCKHPSNDNRDDAVIGKPPNYLMLHRDYHTAVHVNNKIILYGGRTPETKVYSETEFYQFNLTTKRWSCIKTTGYSPGPRNHLIATTIGHFAIYFGGEATYQWDKSYHNDLFVLNTETYHCSQIYAKGCIPSGRCNMAACLRRGDLIISGGETEYTDNESNLPPITRTKFSHDIYILPLLPSLEALCINCAVQNNLNISNLPPRLRRIVMGMTNSKT